jgi:hypothetical protein
MIQSIGLTEEVAVLKLESSCFKENANEQVVMEQSTRVGSE